MIHHLRHRVFQVLEATAPGDRLSRVVLGFLVTLIILNVAAVMLSTVEGLAEAYGPYFHAFEVFSVAVFSVEYVLRLWIAPLLPQFHRQVTGRIWYALTPLALVDLAAILPFYLPMFIPLDLRFMRALRLMRLARLLKIGRYSESVRTLVWVFRERKEELVATLMILAVLMVVASSLVYFAEHEVQPQAFSSIPASMWWAVVTLTTVGYGDTYPVTVLGKLLGGVIAILGVGLVALPAGILGSGFIERLGQRRQRRRCPHCGKDLDESAVRGPAVPPPEQRPPI